MSQKELPLDHKLSVASPEKGIGWSGLKVFALVVLVASVYLAFYKELAGLYPSLVLKVTTNWVDSLFSVYLVFCKELAVFCKTLAGLYPSSVVHKVCLVIANWVDSLFSVYLD
jgi:hypothetical protein